MKSARVEFYVVIPDQGKPFVSANPVSDYFVMGRQATYLNHHVSLDVSFDLPKPKTTHIGEITLI